MKVLVIIPAYNEQESILSVVKSVVDAGYDYVVINDGSTDQTFDLCCVNGINVLDLKCNLGIGGAVQAGHKYAKHHGYDVDIQFDGDGQHDVAFIPDLLQRIEDGSDLAIGSRFARKKNEGFRSTFMRRVGIAWLSSLIRVVSGVCVTDPTSGFRACGSKAIDLYCSSYPIDYPEPESIVVAKREGLSISETPVVMNERRGGVSSIGPLSSVYYMVKVTLAILIASMSGFRFR